MGCLTWKSHCQVELLLVRKGDMATPLGEVILIGEGLGKAQHSHLCGAHHGSKVDQPHMGPPGTSSARDTLPALTRGYSGKETPCLRLQL